ncbi:hypothetical protein PR048_016723 [Dryococelus australis]|uniref:Uncharacterized protein n=1 Tax=Dryococelus australis TaxID=614101 RepID=A0ABQ9H7M4_9NEOP|nr:hypothetical protein PR048_016723 [Dryococelus australis]
MKQRHASVGRMEYPVSAIDSRNPLDMTSFLNEADCTMRRLSDSSFNFGNVLFPKITPWTLRHLTSVKTPTVESTSDIFSVDDKHDNLEFDGRSSWGPRWFSGEAGSIPDGDAPDDAAGRRVFSGISRFTRPCIPVLLYNSPCSPFIGSQDLDVNSRPYLPTSHPPLRIQRFGSIIIEQQFTDGEQQIHVYRLERLFPGLGIGNYVE